MGKLFGVAENNITYHLKNIFNSNELEENSVTQKIRVTDSEGDVITIDELRMLISIK